MGQRGKAYSQEEKDAALRLYYRHNRQLRMVSKVTGIPDSTIASWVKTREDAGGSELKQESGERNPLFSLLEAKVMMLLGRVLDWENLKDKFAEADLKDITKFIEALPKNLKGVTQLFMTGETSMLPDGFTDDDLGDLEDIEDRASADAQRLSEDKEED